jgi:hypothetical protein
MGLHRARLTTPWIVLLASILAAMLAALLGAPVRSRAQAPQPNPSSKQMTLMGTLSKWKYPGSKMLGGASMSDGGNPSVPDVKCRAILTTPDPVETVAQFYSEMLKSPPAAGGQPTGADAKEAAAQAVTIQDDSDRRPVTLRVIIVNRADTTTTLVISRAKDEKETHIAWTHYRRIEGY